MEGGKEGVVGGVGGGRLAVEWVRLEEGVRYEGTTSE